MQFITIETLTREAFAPFGDVIEACDSIRHFAINSGYAERYHDLATIDVAQMGGRPLVSIFRAKPRTFPMAIEVLERHPLGSQAFIPMSHMPFFVVVAVSAQAPRASELRCFVTQAGQGVNYRPGVWHHPLIATDASSDFLVIDRGTSTSEPNYDEAQLAPGSLWLRCAS